jgi:hypothetical protein
MTRFIIPVLMFATAGYLQWYNGAHTDRKLLFPFLDGLAGYKGDLAAQATLSFQVLIGLATVLLLWAAFDWFRSMRQNPAPPAEG